MTDFLDDIVASAPGMQRLVAEEAFILDAIEEIYAAMEQAGVSKTDLAHAMNLRPVLKLENNTRA